jgi:2-oxoglutarate dehydrogenase E2 component (dihydrolipoamide succinyltransferase)
VAAGAHPRQKIVVALDARRLSRARRAVEDINASAQLTSAVEVDVTALVGRLLIGQQNALPANGDVRALILPYLAAAIATTLASHPMLNARIDVTAGTVTFRDRVDLGVVMSGSRGDSEALIVDAGGMSVERLAHELATLRLIAMAGVQTIEPRGDATFMLFERSVAPVLFETPPLPIGTAASLSLGWVERRPLATANSLGGYLIAWAGYLCLTYDHRLVDGADAARFLSDLSIAFAGDGTAPSAS